MGHIRLGRLPRDKNWREVVELVGGGGGAAEVAEATMEATEDRFLGAASDPAVVRTVWLLAQLPDAAKAEDYAEALRGLGLDVPDAPSVYDLASAFGRAVDDYVFETGRPHSDLGEMARVAAMETLSRVIQDQTEGLFGSRPEDVQRALAKLGTDKQFGALSREFFGRLTERVLTYFVSRELPAHVGDGRRFATPDDQRAFERAVATHAYQAARIVETFAGGWYSKARFEKDLSPERTARFVGYAMTKMRGELKRGAT